MSTTQLKTRTTKAVAELLTLARTGKLHGIAYAIIKEDEDGGLSAGSNVIWNGDPRIATALTDTVGVLKGRLEDSAPKSSIIIPN